MIQGRGVPLVGLTNTTESGATARAQSEGRPTEIGGQRVPTSPRDARQNGGQQVATANVHLRRFTAVLVGAGAFLRGVLALGTLGISEGIKAGIDKAVANYGTKKTGNTPIPVTIPGTGEQVSLDTSFLPKRIPKGMSPDQLRQEVQAKINSGHQLVQQLNNGTHGTNGGSRCSVKDMSDIMFFLQAKAESAKGSFKEGAFTLSDPGQRIRTFLDSCPQAYQRDSSHITAFQAVQGGGHRGIDANGGGNNFDNVLPHGMKTLLYGTLAQSDGLKMPEDRLYLKIESHGAWLSRPRGGDDANGPHRAGNHHDVGAFLGHSLSFIATRGQGSAEGTFKERIPNTVKNGYNQLIESMPEPAKTTLAQGGPTNTAAGVRVMLDNVQKALAQVTPGSDEHTKLSLFETSIRQNYNHPELRFGNEIIFTAQDIG